MNDHIAVNKIDIYTAKEFQISKYDEMVKFSRWLEDQVIRFQDAKHALRCYRGIANMPSEDEVREAKPTYTKTDFKNRQQLNNFLRQHGYTWHQIAPMNEAEEDRYGESWRWQLFSDDDMPVTVQEALNRI